MLPKAEDIDDGDEELRYLIDMTFDKYEACIAELERELKRLNSIIEQDNFQGLNEMGKFGSYSMVLIELDKLKAENEKLRKALKEEKK